ncbi:MAG: hypothetical protein FJY95_22370, partial [Candidatus Handelsmanbacteria bacterium]|nr:hypothetical protein [Candidatus Handelsmanbacteria bacterium]
MVRYEGRAVLLRVREDFGGRGTLSVQGLRLSNFVNVSAPASLELWLTGARRYHSSDGKLRIGKPTIQLAENQVFIVEDLNTNLAQITIREDPVAAGMAADRPIMVVVPEGMEWDTGVTQLLVTGSRTGLVSSIVSYTPDKRALVLDVLQDFAAGDSLAIAGLKLANFRNVLRPASLRLRVNDQGVDNALSGNTVAIAQPRMTSAFDQGFAIGDGTLMAAITIIEDSQVAWIKKGRRIRIAVPDSRALRWEGAESLDGTGAAKISAVSVDDSTLTLEVGEDFVPGEAVVVSGLRLRSLGLLPRARLQMSLNDGRTVNAEDSAWVEVGAPAIFSERANIFDLDQQTDFLSTVTIREEATAASITSRNDIRIIIPEPAAVRWGSSPLQASIALSAALKSGSAAGKVANNAQISADGRELLLDVTQAFDPGQTLVLSKLPVHFAQVSPKTSLQLQVTPGIDAADTTSLRVGNPVIGAQVAGTRDTLYVVGDPLRELPPLRLQEDPQVAIINTQHGIAIELPRGLAGVWKKRVGGEVRFTGAAAAKVEPVTEADYTADKVLNLKVNGDFEPGDELQIEGLAIDTLGAASARDTVQVAFLGARYREPALFIQTGAPQLLSAANQSFIALEDGLGDEIESAAALTITENVLAPSIISGQALQVIIPDSLKMMWADPGNLRADNYSGTAAGKLASPTLLNNGKILQFEVTDDFAAGEAITISGLQFRDFARVSRRAPLLLSVTAGFSINARDGRTKRIGHPRLSSDRRQRFIAGISDTLNRITISEDEVEGAIDTGFALEIPPDFDTQWDPGMVVTRAGGERMIPSIEGRRLVFGVARPDTGGQTHALTGLRFLVGGTPSAMDNLILSINGGADERDTQPKWIGGRPSLKLKEDLAFVVNDPDTLLEVVIKDAASVPSIIPEEGLLLSLPENPPELRWTEVTFAGSAADQVQGDNLEFRNNGKVLSVPVTQDFAAGDSLIIRAKISGFTQLSLAQTISLSVVADFAKQKEQTPQTLRIGEPRLSSAYDQAFVAVRDDLDGPVLCAPIHLVEHPSVGAITAKNGIRIAIPDSLAMNWVVENASPVRIAGSAAAHFADSVLTVSNALLQFADNGKTVYLAVESDFAPGDSLSLEGLELRGFEQPSRRAPLGLSVNGGRSINRSDTRTKRVGRPRIATGLLQRFAVGEEGVLMAPVVVEEDRVESAITTKDSIKISLNPDLGNGFVWKAEGVTVAGSAAAKVGPYKLSPNGRELLIPVMADFAAEDLLVVEGLRSGRFETTAAADSLLYLSVNGGVDGKSAGGIKVGNLRFGSGQSQVFRVNDPPGISAPLVLKEDAVVPILAVGDTIHFRLSPTDSLKWVKDGDSVFLTRPRAEGADEVIAVEAPELIGGQKVQGPLYTPDRKTLAYVVSREWAAGDSLQISGMYLGGFGEPGQGRFSFDATLAVGQMGAVESDEELRQRSSGRFDRVDANRLRVAQTAFSSSGVQTFSVDSASVDLLPLALREDPDTSAIDPGTRLHLYIPNTLAAEWDTTRTSLDLAAGSELNRQVQYKQNGEGKYDEAVLTLERLIAPGDSVEIKGLALRNFRQPSPDTHLLLSLNDGLTINTRDGHSKRIGNPTLSMRDESAKEGLQDTAIWLAKSAVDLRNVPDAYPVAMYPLLIREDATAASLVPGDTLRLEIPASFNAYWADAPESITTRDNAGTPYGASKVTSLRREGKTFNLLVVDSLARSDQVEIRGLRLDGFDGASPNTSLLMRISQGEDPGGSEGTAQEVVRASPQQMRIGNPRLVSLTDQVFAVGDSETGKALVTIVENDTAASINTGWDLRLIIPEGLSLKWDGTRSATPLLSGSARDKVEATASLENDGELRLEVTRNFSPGDSLIIDGLWLSEFGSSSAGNLVMWPTGSGYPVKDSATLYVGAPLFYSAADQVFVEGDVDSPLYPITIVEDSRIATIRAGNQIRLALPSKELLAASWKTEAREVRLEGSAKSKVNSWVSFRGDRADTLALEVL